MKRLFSIATLVMIVAFATPLTLAQKPGKNTGKDEQTGVPIGGRSNGQPKSNPQPKPQPPRSNPQPPPQPQPERRVIPADPPKSSGKSNQPPEFEPRRLKATQPADNNPQPRGLPQPQPGVGDDSLRPSGRQYPKVPGGSGDSQGGKFPKSSGQPEDHSRGQFPKSSGQPEDHSRGQFPKSGNNKPDITPPNRGEPAPRFPGNSEPGGNKDKGGSGDAARRSITPSGKPRNLGGDSPNKLTGQPIDPTGHQPAEPAVVRKPLGKPSGRGFQPPEAAVVGGENIPASAQKPPAARQKVLAPGATTPGTSGVEKSTVATPARFRSKQRPVLSDAEPRVKEVPVKKLKPIKPQHDDHVAAPQGGRVYRGKDYHHEYSRHRSSSFALGIGISDGSTAFSFGYAKGGGHSAYALGVSSGYPGGGWGPNPYYPHYHPYWHCPVWYEPVYYTPCYAVATPVYYSPYYTTAVVDPYAYNSSSFAFGYSSFGGSALSSFSFAYSTSHWNAGFGYTAAPCYTIYTPAYDPYFRSVYVPGYYELVDERVWVEGSYDEVVSTPVVETVVDPLGNTYDAVTQPGSVDYLWREGHWTTESRRIYHAGHWENVAVF